MVLILESKFLKIVEVYIANFLQLSIYTVEYIWEIAVMHS